MVGKAKLLHEGKAKLVYEASDSNILIIKYKDTATAFDGKKKENIKDKGIINNAISNILFRLLDKRGIKNHLIESISGREILVKRLKIIPIEVVIRNVVAGSLAKRTGLNEGYELKEPVVEFYYKDDDLGDPLFNNDHIKLLGLASKDELDILSSLGRRINDELVNIFNSIGLILVDFKLEFGYYDGDIILGDEISPDTCRLWDSKTKKVLDKDRFRKDMGNITDSYQEVLNRLKTIKG